MKTKAETICPEKTEFTVLTIDHELNLKKALSVLHQAFHNSDDNVWLDLEKITKTDFNADSVCSLKNFIQENEASYPKGKVVIVADTPLSQIIARTTMSLLRLDGFKKNAQLFSSRWAALQWSELADLLDSRSDCANEG